MIAPDESAVYVIDMDKLQQLQLEPEEAFVLTRIDGSSSLREIAQMLGYDVARVWRLLLRASDAGIIKLKSGSAATKKVTQRDGSKTILDQLDQEESDPVLSKIPRAKRNEILLQFQKTDQQNFYELLGVTPKAQKSEINAKYMALVKGFHPDRYFGMELGHYKQKLERIFNRMTEAFHELTDPKKRQIYDREHLSKEKKKEKEIKDKKPLQLGNTLIERLAKARKFVEMGKQEESNGNHLNAAHLYELALQLDPENKEFIKAHERLLPMLRRKKADDMYKEAYDLLERGELSEAITQMEEAMKLNPKKRECYRDLAILHSKSKKSLEKARKYGEEAVKLFPQDADVKVTLAGILLDLGKLEEAKMEFKAALKINQGHQGAIMGLEKVKMK